MRVGDCDQCDLKSVVIAKKLPSSGSWCCSCNTKRLSKIKKERTSNATSGRLGELGVIIKRLDSIFSIYVRTRDTDVNGITRCVTCGIEGHWSETDCGHCYPRGSFAIRWDERNTHAQCRVCNRMEDGCFSEFSEHIRRRYGVLVFSELSLLKNKVKKLDREELLLMIEKYENLNKQNLSV